MSTRNYLLQVLSDRVAPGSKVLDLGCGNGEILVKLRDEKAAKAYGIDISFEHILACIKHGLNVFQGNIDEGLKEFSDHAFDYVILSQTLQQVRRPLFAVSEMLRVGKRAIIIFPNFAFWKNRYQFALGLSPRTPTLPYKWYNTPNIRVVTIHDFKMMCKKKGYRIIEQAPASNRWIDLVLLPFSNLLSPIGIFIIEKGPTQ
jgi:methionine biosynthesis protein MetW